MLGNLGGREVRGYKNIITVLSGNQVKVVIE